MKIKYNRHNIALTKDEEFKFQQVKTKGFGIKKTFMKGNEVLIREEVLNTPNEEEV